MQPCEEEKKAHQDLRDDKFHHLHVDLHTDIDAWMVGKSFETQALLTHKVFFSEAAWREKEGVGS